MGHPVHRPARSFNAKKSKHPTSIMASLRPMVEMILWCSTYQLFLEKNAMPRLQEAFPAGNFVFQEVCASAQISGAAYVLFLGHDNVAFQSQLKQA